MRKAIVSCAAVLVAAAIPAWAGNASSPAADTHMSTMSTPRKATSNASGEVDAAAGVVRRMLSREPALGDQVRQARAVFVMPKYGRGALLVGGSGGPGVLMVRQGNTWIGPVLYKVGATSIGAQAGGEAGSLVMILKSERALRDFDSHDNFALKADAGLSIVRWSKAAETRTSAPDIVMWTDFKGAYAGASVGASDIRYDRKETGALYGKRVDARDILQGTEHTAFAKNLADALPAA